MDPRSGEKINPRSISKLSTNPRGSPFASYSAASWSIARYSGPNRAAQSRPIASNRSAKSAESSSSRGETGFVVGSAAIACGLLSHDRHRFRLTNDARAGFRKQQLLIDADCAGAHQLAGI